MGLHRTRPGNASGLLTALMWLAVAVAGCDSREEEVAPMAPPQVTVMPPVRREVTDWDEFTGRFAGTERVELRARVGGYLESVTFTDGQVVRRGDLLFRIDPRPFAAAVAEAEARLTSARSQLTLAEREYERAKSLLQYRAGSEASLEQHAQALEAARAGVSHAEAALNGPGWTSNSRR